MDWISRLNEAIGYIEDNLTDEVDVEVAARIACCSTFHFIRMFTYIAGVSLSEYVRRRRLTMAALEIQRKAGKIIDIALRYGYESPTAFTRAFHTIHGISPSAAKRPGTSLNAYPRMHFSMAVTGGTRMEYRIERKEGFRIVGLKRRFSVIDDACYADIPQFWQQVIAQGSMPKLLGLLDGEPAGLLGVCGPMEGKEFDYLIGVPSGQEDVGPFVPYDIQAMTWAIFPCIGAMPSAIQDLQKRVLTEWLPTSGYAYADAPDIEVYFEGDQRSPAYRSEVWLPIRRMES